MERFRIECRSKIKEKYEKKWAIITTIGIVFFILIKFIFIPKIMIFCDIYTTLQQSKHELYDKQKELVQKEIVKINYNGNEINEDEPLAFMVRQIEFSKSKISMNTKEKNYNNSLEFITDRNEKIEFKLSCNVTSKVRKSKDLTAA